MQKFRLAMAILATGFSTLGLIQTCLAQPAVVKVEHAWIRATVPNQQATGAFMDITADKTLQLIKVATPLSPIAQLHEMVMTPDGVMKMQVLKYGLKLPANQIVKLKPGGYHIMIMGLKDAVKAGRKVAITLTFSDEQQHTFTEKVEAVVLPVSATGQASTYSQ